MIIDLHLSLFCLSPATKWYNNNKFIWKQATKQSENVV